MATFRGLLAIAALLPLMELRAQSADTPWAAFVGCWLPLDDQTPQGELMLPETVFSPPTTCIIPDAENALAARFITAQGGEVLRTVTLVADGTRVARSDARCTGWDAASFSDDGARIYLTGETTCGASPPVRSSGIMALLPNGTRLLVKGTQGPDGERLEVERSLFAFGRGLSGATSEALIELTLSTVGARANASRAFRLSDVMEASGRVHASVAEVWIAETAIVTKDAPLPLQRGELRALAVANVPPRVIDMLVAAANPTHFRVGITQGGATAQELSVSELAAGAPRGPAWNGAGWAARTGMRGISGAQCAQLFDAFALAAFGIGPRPEVMVAHAGRLSECFGYSAFGLYGPFGGFGRWWPTRYSGYLADTDRRPIRVTVDPVTGGAPRPVNGRVVRGQGYTSSPDAPSTGERAQPRDGAVRSPRSAESGASASPVRSPASAPVSVPSGTSAPASSGGASESGGRTAKPRTP